MAERFVLPEPEVREQQSGPSPDPGPGLAPASATIPKKPCCIIVLGMAGSGKTTFVQRLTSQLHAAGSPPYVVNLDPACREVPYPANIDIRDTVNYKQVMKQYKLGPNGGIVTSLNLFATKFDQVLQLVASKDNEFVILDTPGQIEVFTWSASGNIITESLAAQMPTVVVYVMDSVRSTSPVTFMSNMLYACSILYKCKLPFVVAMNKIDVVSHKYALEWMEDFEAFQEALAPETSYVSSLAQSMSLALDEFYAQLKAVGVSAMTGEGVAEFLAAVRAGREEYHTEYWPEYQRLRRDREQLDLHSRQAGPDLQSGKGTEVKLGLCHTMREEVEVPANITDGIYLRHPGDEEEEEEGEVDRDQEEESREADSFRNFIESRNNRTEEKIKTSLIEEKLRVSSIADIVNTQSKP